MSWAKRKITIWKNWNTGSAPRRSKTFCRPQNGRGGSVLVWNRLYNKAAVKGLEFPVNVQPAEDTTYTLKVLFQIKSMVSTDAEFLFYRDSSTSVMNQGKPTNMSALMRWPLRSYMNILSSQDWLKAVAAN